MLTAARAPSTHEPHAAANRQRARGTYYEAEGEDSQAKAVVEGESYGTNGNGIDGSLAADDDSTAKLLIQGNTVSGQRQGAMFFNANNTGDLDVTLFGNTMNSRPADTTAFENLTVSANGTSIACTNIQNNSVAQGGADAFGAGVPADAFRLDDDDPPDPNSTVKLERGNSASNDPKQVVRDNNPTSVSNTVSTSATITLVPNNTCALPGTTPAP